jgi:hypothetical protein
MAHEERQILRGLAEIILASPRFATALLIRRRHLRWGATDAEVAAPMPGDELVPRSSFTATRAITIDAPPEAVWPWLVQLGDRRAGWYTYDLLDNAGYPSADRILSEHQNLRVGDRVPMAKKVNDIGRRLVSVERSVRIPSPGAAASLLPPGLPELFDTAQLAEAASVERRLAQQMTYCLRAMGVLDTAGKRGNAILHRRVESQWDT